MMTKAKFDYYYGNENNQFSFFRIPRQLMTGKRFKRLSTEAKLLYGLLLDRMGLSAKNGWHDEAGRIYVYYTLREIQENFNCGHDKATKLLVELDSGRGGFGLIERVKQGIGLPAKIYVKRLIAHDTPSEAVEPQDSTNLPISSSQDFGNSEVQTSENRKSGLREIRSQECGKSAPSYTELSKTDFSYINPSINLSGSTENEGLIDRYDCREAPEAQAECQDPCQQPVPSEMTVSISKALRLLTRLNSVNSIVNWWYNRLQWLRICPERKPKANIEFLPQSQPAWHLIAQMPLVRGRPPKTPETENMSQIETHFLQKKEEAQAI